MKHTREKAERAFKVRHFVEPEMTILTEEKRTAKNEEETNMPKYDAHVHTEAIRQWVNKTVPIKQPFEGQSSKSTCSDEDTYSPYAYSKSLPTVCDTESVYEEWQRRAFDRTYADIVQKYEQQQINEDYEAQKINEKIDRYKKAFLKGFYEARIKRIERNKWLYEKLHVNPDYIKDKFRRLMYNSQSQFISPNKSKSNRPDEKSDLENGLIIQDDDQKYGTQLTTQDNVDAESLYSFVPERDNVLLQDENAPPQIRGFGRDKLHSYDATIRLLSLNQCIPPDVQDWLNEKKLENLENWEERSDRISSIEKQDRNEYENNLDWKYEQIPGMNTDLPQWLGPKKLDENEIDLEHFRADEENTLNVKSQRKVNEYTANKADEQSYDEAASTTESNSSPACLLRKLIQSQSKDYYRLWYSTHDMYNTTPFLEARLQRLIREVLGKREWNLYSSYLKRKSENLVKSDESQLKAVQ